MALDTETCEYQQQLAAICRSGNVIDIPGVKADRSQVYRRLIFNGIEDALKRAYPLCFKALFEKDNTNKYWNDLVRKFIAEYPSSSPHLWQMPKGLIDFTSARNLAGHYELPYLVDLMRFEWLEIELFMMEDLQVGKPANFHAAGKFSKNPESRVLNLSYPVYQKPLADCVNSPGIYFICCFREPVKKQVRYLVLSALQVLILERTNTVFSIEDLTVILNEICTESGLNCLENNRSLENFIKVGCSEGLFTQ